jgi:hypothetical protein
VFVLQQGHVELRFSMYSELSILIVVFELIRINLKITNSSVKITDVDEGSDDPYCLM